MAVIQRSDNVVPLRGWRAELRDGVVRLADGERQRHADFHLSWLRDEISADASARAPDTIDVDDGVLRIRWRDGKLSRFPITWLLQHAYALGRAGAVAPPSNVDAIELPAPTIGSDALRRAFAVVDQRGAVVLRRETTTPADETGAWHAELALADFRPVATSPLPAREVPLPAALPDVPPGDEARHYQILHVRAPTRALLLLADQGAVLNYLASIDAEAARRLLATPPRPDTRPHLPFADIESWYRARDLFAGIARDPRYHYRLRVRPGDLVIYDRRRTLYGQTESTERAVHALNVLGSGSHWLARSHGPLRRRCSIGGCVGSLHWV